MATNGQLIFTDVDKVTFKGVGNTSNAVIDTTTGKIGVGVDSPDANLHVLGNCFVSTNFELGGTMTMGTVTVRAQHELSAITATGNTTPHTVEFQNATTGLVTTGNVSVGKDLTVSGNVEVGTANLFVNTVNSRVGVGTTSPAAQLEIHGIGQTSETTFDQTGSMGGVLALRSDDGSAGSGGAVMFGSHAGFHAAIKASLEDGSTNTRGRLAFFTRSNTTDATMSHAMTIADGGNVGIGTNNPTSKLHVTGNIEIPLESSLSVVPTDNFTYDGDSMPHYGLMWRNHSDYTGAPLMQLSAHQGFKFFTTGTERVFIKNNGYVGVGTTDPGALLHVNGDIAVGANGSLRRTADNDLINIYAGSDNTSPYMFMTGKSRSSNANKIGFRIASATKFELYSDKAYFADNVGIGTTDPKTRLHVNHDLHLQSSSEAWSTTAGKGLYLRYSTTGGQNAAYIQSIDRSNTSLSYPMIFQGSSYQFSVGNVGIGTNTPLGRLHVQTETRSGTEGSGNGIYVTSGCAEYSNGSEFRHSNQSQGVGIGYAGIYATGSNTNQDLSIVSRGTGTTYVKNYAVFSDDRIKTNEEYIMNATETLMKLKPQVYDKHEEINVLSDNPKREAGLIAQDIYYDTPELRYIVSTRNRGIDAEPVNIPSEKPFVDDDPQKDPDYSGWGTASAGVAYIQLVPYLIKSNQEIYTELQTLKARLNALENAS
jgi:hypothetical protein